MAVLLVLSSAFLHAFWNGVLKAEPDKTTVGVAVVGMAALIATGFALVVSMFSELPPFPTTAGIVWSAGAGLCEALYFALLIAALCRAPLAVAYPASRGFAVLVVWPISVLVFGEAVGAGAIGGTALVCIGLAVTSLGERAAASGLVLACLCGLAIAGYHLCYKSALVTGASPSAIFALSLLLAFPLNVLRLGRTGVARLAVAIRRRLMYLLGLGTLCAASFLLFLVALHEQGAGLVVTLRNTSILFAALIAFAQGERPGRKQWIGCVLTGLGAIVVSLP